MKRRALQLFDRDYLKKCRRMTPMQILRFLEDFRKLYGSKALHKHKKKDNP